MPDRPVPPLAARRRHRSARPAARARPGRRGIAGAGRDITDGPAQNAGERCGHLVAGERGGPGKRERAAVEPPAGYRYRHAGEIMNIDTACCRRSGWFDKIARLDRSALAQHVLHEAVGAQDHMRHAGGAQGPLDLRGIAGEKRNRRGHLGAQHREFDDAAHCGALRSGDERALPCDLIRLRRRDQR